MKVELGIEVKDKVTGFKGITIARTEWLNGCARIGVQAKMKKDGTVPDSQWFDEPQLDIINKNKIKLNGEKKPPGGPQPTPKRSTDPNDTMEGH